MALSFVQNCRRAGVAASGLFLLSVFYLPLLQASAEESCIGFVTYTSGSWSQTKPDGTRAPVKKYSAICDGAMLKADSESDEIEIKLCDRRTVSRRGNKLSKKPVVLKKEPIDLLARAMKLFSEHPQDFISTMAKGSSALTDAIVVCEKNGPDLSEVFQAMSPGKYLFRLRPINGKSDAEKIGPFTANVRVKEKIVVSIGGTKPGLFELATIERRPGKEDAVLQKCWIFLVDEKQRADAANKWKAALEKTKDWKERPNACSRSCFLKAVLFSLARESTGDAG